MNRGRDGNPNRPSIRIVSAACRIGHISAWSIPGVFKFFAEAPGLLVAEGLVTLQPVMHDGNRIRTRAGDISPHRDSSLEDTQRWHGGWWRNWGSRKEMTETGRQRLAR